MNNPFSVTLLVTLLIIIIGAIGYLTGSPVIFKWSSIGGLAVGALIVVAVVRKSFNKT